MSANGSVSMLPARATGMTPYVMKMTAPVQMAANSIWITNPIVTSIAIDECWYLRVLNVVSFARANRQYKHA